VTDNVSDALVNVGSIVAGTGLVFALLRQKFAKVDRIEADMTQLKDQRVARLEKDVERVRENGCVVGREVLQKLDHANGMLGKLDLKLDRIAEDTAGQAAKIDANNAYIRNIDSSLQRHKETAHG